MCLALFYYHVTYAFQSESTFYNCLNVKKSLLETIPKSEVQEAPARLEARRTYFVRTVNSLSKQSKGLSCLVSTCLHGVFDCMFLSCHVFFSGWVLNLYFRECQEVLAQKNREIGGIWDWSWIPADNNLFCKQTANIFVEQAKGLNYLLSIHLHGAFDCMFLPIHVPF